MARIQPISEMFRIARIGTLAQIHDQIVKVAKREHAKVMNTDPMPSSFTRIVDGVTGAREEQVKSNGMIVYQYPRLEEVTKYALEVLFDLSPVLSGDYRNSHTLFINGVAATDLNGWKRDDEISISNPLPYSRKIEVGAMKMRVPGTDHVYQQASAKVKARYGNVATISFTFRAIFGQNIVNQSKAPRIGTFGGRRGAGADARAAAGVIESTIAKKHGKTAHNQSNMRFPVLIIKER